jgi:SAM-dependent methyltransferase
MLAAYYASGTYRADHGPAALYFVGEDRMVRPTDPEYEPTLDRVAHFRAECIVHDLRLTEGARVLEVGCGDGRLLAALESLRMDVAGIEPDEAEAAKATARGLRKVQVGTLEEFTIVRNSFDVVVAVHVLEHFPSPRAALAHMRLLLKPGGAIWLEVPNVHQPIGPLEGNHWQAVHLYDFSPPTLIALLVRAGLSSCAFAETGAALQAYAYNLDAGPRPYLSHGGLGGEWVAQYLAEYAARHEPDTALAELAKPAATEAARMEREILRSLQPEIKLLIDANVASEELSRRLAEALYSEAFDGLSRFSDGDSWVNGFGTGYALALQRCARLFTHHANAMVLASQEREG